MKRELEAEKRAAAAREGKEESATPLSDCASPPPSEAEDMSPLLAVRGVYFKCPLIGKNHKSICFLTVSLYRPTYQNP